MFKVKGKYSDSTHSALDDKEEEVNAKNVMADQTAKGTRVWTAFTKFIRSQCCNKNRAVDTQLIGLFIPANGKVTYMPDSDFLEAGKFKLQRN
tara:strand:- start:150 stop:428 length:279 start_codon:yes stop_codon:yes gene_type:complete